VQVVDDRAGATLASASTRSKHLSAEVGYGGNRKAAEVVGTEIAKQSLGVGIKCVVLDRSCYKYHGRVKSLAEAAREAGLVF
jgi:large subunit ribosomal protein L18